VNVARCKNLKTQNLLLQMLWTQNLNLMQNLEVQSFIKVGKVENAHNVCNVKMWHGGFHMKKMTSQWMVLFR
jgi:hypothetical protein